MSSAADGELLTVAVDDPGDGVAALLDDATTRIAELEIRGYHARRLSVPPAAYERIAETHGADLRRGVPLIVLGLPLTSTTGA